MIDLPEAVVEAAAMFIEVGMPRAAAEAAIAAYLAAAPAAEWVPTLERALKEAWVVGERNAARYSEHVAELTEKLSVAQSRIAALEAALREFDSTFIAAISPEWRASVARARAALSQPQAAEETKTCSSKK